MLQRIGLFLCFVFFASALSGCCTAPPAGSGSSDAVAIHGEVLVSENINPRRKRRPQPVVLRIYQLRSIDKFKDGDFLALDGNDEQVLGEDLIFKEEMDVYPGTRVPFQRKWDRATRYLGVMAVFGDWKSAKWRTFLDLSRGGVFPIVVTIEGSSVSIWHRADGM